MTTMTRERLAPAELSTIDLADSRVHAEYELADVWRHLRATAPVHYQPPTAGHDGFWVVTRYTDVAEVFRDAESFTSERGNVLDTLLAGGDSAAGRMLAVTDGAAHAGLRAVLLKAFAPRALQHVVRSVRTGTRKLLTDALRKGDCDFASDVASNIPISAICDLLGVPPTDRLHILSLTSSALGSEHGVLTDADAWSAKNEILLYFAELARERRDTPYSDIVSLLVTSEVGGRALTDEEVIFNCYSLILGGDETTRLSMIGAVAALIEHPRQWAALKSGEVAVESAVEEVLRWTTPALHAGRTAARDTELGGRAIAAGDIVTIWNSSANRDERAFDRPELFDLSRTPNKHMTFAFGPHFCLGAYLARVEVGAVLEGLRDMASLIEPAGPTKRIYSNFLSGICSLPVTLTLDESHVPASAEPVA